MIKKLISVVIGAGLVMAVAAPAFAVNTCSNDTTGALSKNYCDVLAKKKVRVPLNNTGNVTNNVLSNSNTGYNTSSYNTVSGTSGILTWDAMATSNPVLTTLNANSVPVNQSVGDAAGAGYNYVTGYNSTNNVTIDLRKKVKVDITNDGWVVNTVSSTANTGYNTSSYNTVGGDIMTGNATATSAVSTTVNSNTVSITQ